MEHICRQCNSGTPLDEPKSHKLVCCCSLCLSCTVCCCKRCSLQHSHLSGGAPFRVLRHGLGGGIRRRRRRVALWLERPPLLVRRLALAQKRPSLSKLIDCEARGHCWAVLRQSTRPGNKLPAACGAASIHSPQLGALSSPAFKLGRPGGFELTCRLTATMSSCASG
jgi:hypothetical protein